MESLAAYIPMDRRQAMVKGEDLPDRTEGAALFADISGYTPLVATLVEKYSPKIGADKGTQVINHVFEQLITWVHNYRGSVIGFGGDSLTCWFDGDHGLRATACALAMQDVMAQLAQNPPWPDLSEPLRLTVGVAAGPARRFRIGGPAARYLDVLAGQTVDRAAAAEKKSEPDKVALSAEVVAQRGNEVNLTEWRLDSKTGERFALVAGLTSQVEPAPWPPLPLAGTAINGLTAAQLRPWLLPPVYERVRYGQQQLLGEYRPIVVLFMHFSGLNYDGDDLAGEKLDQYIRWVQTILARYEGYLIKLSTGDKGNNLMATFGAPLAHDDDVNRAVAAALELCSLPQALDFICDVQIGLSRDRMLAGAFGSATRCAYDLLGDETNMAARLMTKEGLGRILTTKWIEAKAANRYYFNDLGKHLIYGREEPMQIFEVAGKRPPPLLTFTADLVGRETELEQLKPLLDEVQAGKGQILRLEGAAGVGKSSLAKAFVLQALERGFQVASGRCENIGQTTTYYVWRQIFWLLFELTDDPLAGETRAAWQDRQIDQIKEIIDDINPDWLNLAPLLGDLLALPMPDSETTALFDPQLRQGALFALALEIVQTWARGQPALLLIEDAHWLDEASRALTSALGRAITNTPLILMIVHRPPVHQDEAILPKLEAQAGYHHLRLQGLALPQVAELLRERLPGQPSPLVTSLIQTLSQGNPFFIEQLIHTLRQTGGLYRHDDNTWRVSETIFNRLRQANYLVRNTPHRQWALAPDAQLTAVDLGLPDSMHGLTLSRIDPLPEAYKLTLKVASVIGHAFGLDLLAAAHPVPQDQGTLYKQMVVLEEHDIIYLAGETSPQPTYVFKHHLIQEAVYETLLPGQGLALHHAVAEALEGLRPEAVETLAHHYRHSQIRAKTLFYLDKAARKAQREYANETALNYYNQALGFEARWEWLKGKVEVLHILGQREAEEAALRLLANAPAAPAFEVAYLWGQYYEAMSDYPGAQSHIEQAREIAQNKEDVAAIVRCLAQLGLVARKQGDLDRAKDWYRQALGLLEAEEAYPDEEIQVLNGLGLVHRQQGNFEQAEACYQHALTLSEQSGHRLGQAQALDSLGTIAYHDLRDFAGAMAYQRQALRIRQEIGDRLGEGITLFNLATIMLEAGDYGQAKDYLLKALTIHQLTSNRREEVNVLIALGVLYYFVGDLPQAQEHLQQSLTISRAIGDQEGVLYILGNLGLVARDQGDLVAAEQLFTDGLSLARKFNNPYLEAIVLGHLSTVSLAERKFAQSIERAKAALKIRRAHGWELWSTGDLATLAKAYLASGEQAQAQHYAREALKILDDCGGQGPEFPHHDYFTCSQVFSETGQQQTARVALQAAYKLVMARAGKISDPAMHRSFLEQVPLNRQIVWAFTGGK